MGRMEASFANGAVVNLCAGSYIVVTRGFVFLRFASRQIHARCTTPLDESDSPEGSEPLMTTNAYGLMPPLAPIVCEYITPDSAFGSDAETVIVGHTDSPPRRS
jgi:hypothetical protein